MRLSENGRVDVETGNPRDVWHQQCGEVEDGGNKVVVG
jgi:hypothetical protein